MKRQNAIQLTIIIMALVLAFFTLQQLFSSLILVVLQFLAGGSLGNGYFVSPLMIIFEALIKGVVAWILITKSGDIAEFISLKANFNGSMTVRSQPSDLLYILLIVLGIYFMLNELPLFLKGILAEFRTKAPHSRFETTERLEAMDWTRTILNMILASLLLMFAKPISVYFAKDLSNNSIIIQDETEHTHLLGDIEE